jgi:hypothetical protein
VRNNRGRTDPFSILNLGLKKNTNACFGRREIEQTGDQLEGTTDLFFGVASQKKAQLTPQQKS